MNIEQAVQNLEDIKSKYTWSIGADGALDMAISALRAQNLQQTCNQLATNTIDRQVAIDAILREYNADDSDYPTDYQQGLHAAKKIIEQLPSVQPEQLTDNEKRIFLAAMTREELMCLQIDEEFNGPNLVNLVEICHEITRKVKGALWTI